MKVAPKAACNDVPRACQNAWSARATPHQRRVNPGIGQARARWSLNAYRTMMSSGM